MGNGMADCKQGVAATLMMTSLCKVLLCVDCIASLSFPGCVGVVCVDVVVVNVGVVALVLWLLTLCSVWLVLLRAPKDGSVF